MENIIKLAGIEFTKKEVENIYNNNLYIVKYSTIHAVHYSSASQCFYASLIYKNPEKNMGFSQRGRYYLFSAHNVNYLLGFQLLNE